MKYIIWIGIFCLSACDTPKETVVYKVAYNTGIPDSAENYDVFITGMDGSGRKNISDSKSIEWTYYAYKDRLFYISDKDTAYKCYFLYEMDAKGNGKKRVSVLRLEDSWMSCRNDGGEIIVAGRIGKDVRYQLFIIDTKTGDFRQLTNDTAARYSDPSFSPDGNRIAFVYQKNKRDTSAHEELYVMNSDGSGITQLSHYPENDPALHSYEYKAGTVRWHPGGKFITYISYQSGRNNIFRIAPDGREQARLTTNNMDEGWYDWSDDGKWLVFHSKDKSNDRQYHIMLMNWETKDLKQLTDTAFKVQLSPVFVRGK